MQKGDPFPLCTNTRNLIDQLDSEIAAASEHLIEIIDREADVMNPGATPRDEFSNWSIGRGGLQQLDETLSSTDRRDASSIRIGNLRLLHPEHIAKKRQLIRDRLQRNTNVCDPGAFQGSILH